MTSGYVPPPGFEEDQFNYPQQNQQIRDRDMDRRVDAAGQQYLAPAPARPQYYFQNPMPPQQMPYGAYYQGYYPPQGMWQQPPVDMASATYREGVGHQPPAQTCVQVPVYGYYQHQPAVAQFPLPQPAQHVPRQRIEAQIPRREPASSTREIYPKTVDLKNGRRVVLSKHVMQGIHNQRGELHHFSEESVKKAVENEAVFNRMMDSEQRRTFIYYTPKELHGERDSFTLVVGAKKEGQKTVVTIYDIAAHEYPSQMNRFKHDIKIGEKEIYFVTGENEITEFAKRVKVDDDKYEVQEDFPNAEEAANMLQRLAKFESK